MIDTPEFYDYLIKNNLDTFFGVPDSLLKDICAYITSKTSPDKHIITANEGNAIALASGTFMATGRPAVVYMQNSGLGNAINPLISLSDEEVYKIPMLLLIGWRGEPNVHDEPQHLKQGKITLSLLDTMGIKYLILTDNFKQEIDQAVQYMNKESKSFAIIVKKNMFSKFNLNDINNPFSITREDALESILSRIDKDSILVSTTGKTSREVFELRKKKQDSNERDFLTVGSMGHTASIALGISLSTKKNVYCIDGDGSMLMHLGGLGIVAKNAQNNFKYIVINNGSHESVGGQPTIAFDLNLNSILTGLGFNKVFEVSTIQEINSSFEEFDSLSKSVLVINVKQGSRENLGRPTSTPQENKEAFMKFISK
jgi:phosphonopyruvate decarboxylase